MANIRKSIRIDAKDLMDGLEKFEGRTKEKVQEALQDYRRELVLWMRHNRPWKDQTSKARLSLDARIEMPTDSRFRIALSHGVFYGKYLEYGYSNGRKFPILGPAQRKYESEILNRLRSVIS